MNAHSITPETFDAQKKTLIAVLLSFLTMGFYIQFWFVTLYLRLNNIKQDDIIKYSVPFIPPMLSGWNTYIISTFHMSSAMETLSVFLIVFSFISAIYISFVVTDKLEQALVADGYAVKMSKVWTFFLPGFYQYYIITNIVGISNKNLALQEVIRRQSEDNKVHETTNDISDNAANVSSNNTNAG